MTLSSFVLYSIAVITGSAVEELPLIPENGDFVYLSSDGKVNVSFQIIKANKGMFSIDCGYERYEDGPFLLIRVPGKPRIVHEFPDEISDERHVAWVARAREACPHLAIANDDLLCFYMNNAGDLETQFAGERIILSLKGRDPEQEWLPLVPGRFLTNPTTNSAVQIQYDIHPDNAVYVRFGCTSGDTGYMIYKLVSQGPGKKYKLTAYPGRNTVDDLVTKYKTVCPGSTNSFDFDENFGAVGFASSDVLYVFGNSTPTRLDRQPL